ncbi:hypothetical protein OAV41_02110 [Planctomycetota bacterium]|jgi:hypothetical protein|nr:hypothetical protein [Planctomycetota bacterium]
MPNKKKMPEAPPSRSKEFKKYKKKMGMADNVTMSQLMKDHPMNTEGYKSQGGKMKAEPMYAKIGCKVYNNR